ncbi:MAG: ABC transporter ATP-binding protein [Spirochaetaceae bacterium]|jgi:iron complex transport system ATP-binding protein|nr:ABC transporter ATP-binding protein [Spirochaetaceae bacterium]
MISVENASFYYDAERALFNGLSFALEKNRTLAILGPNGVGKTSLLRCLMRFLRLKNGAIYVDGTDNRAIADSLFWRTVSYVPQAKNMTFGYSVLNVVMMGRCPYIGMGRQPGKADLDAAKDVMSRLGLAHLAERSCNSLSGGELQMALIARALVKKPSLLIMDEPESNLDMKNQLKILETIQRLKSEQNLTIILNTHFPTHALRVADKALLLGTDRYLYDDTRTAITEQNIREYFGVLSEIVEMEPPPRTGRTGFKAVVPTDCVQCNQH